MRTNLIAFVLVSENRKKIVKTLLAYPKRQWSCSGIEEITRLPHATVFRALSGLYELGILKSIKVNRKDILYELVDSPLMKELKRIISIDRIATREVATSFISKIKSKNIQSVILFGSAVKETLNPESDIDILIIMKKHDKLLEEKIKNIAAEVSSKVNKTISATIMDIKEVNKEKNGPFINSIKDNKEVLYGKSPF